MRGRGAILVLAALALADCGSSPKTRYFTLAPESGTAQDKARLSSPVTVAAVHLPPSLDRRGMVRRTGETTVDISDQDRWTAPLDEMIRSVLSQDLAARLPKDMVVLPNSPSPPHTAQIVVSIAQFGPDASGKVTLEGGWSLLEGAGGTPAMRRDFSLEARSPADNGSSQAAAMSLLLGQLAAQIATALPGSA